MSLYRVKKLKDGSEKVIGKDFITEMKVDPMFIPDLISGKKFAELRSWHKPLENKYVKLTNSKTNVPFMLFRCGEVIDLNGYDDDTRETMYNELNIPQSFLDNYDARYMYTIEEKWRLQ